jgi:hypothetical protein
MARMTAATIETFLQNLLVGDPDEELLGEVRSAPSFDDAGVLCNNGLVLRMHNGAEFHITIVQSVNQWQSDDDDQFTEDSEESDNLEDKFARFLRIAD